MKTIKVWAPNANKVELQIRNSRLTMTKNHNNWWAVEVPAAEHGDDYVFILDDGQPIPDPRSPWQPNGVFGASRIFDHNKFSWQDTAWQAPPLTSAIVYELHVGTFSAEGTFDGIINHLEFLKNLGITHIEIMPINGFSGSRGWGYDGVNLYAPHETYGGPDGLKRLVNACHNIGLAVILDVVYNHLGPEGNYLAHFGPYFTDRYASPWGKTINFDGQESNEVRRFFCDNATMWLRDFHIDVLRIDAVHAIIDNSAIHLLEQLAHEVKELQSIQNRHFYLITESDLNDSRHLHTWDAGGYGIDAQWNDDFHHALHTILTGERTGYYADYGSLADLEKAYTKIFIYDGCYSNFRKCNHGRPAIGLSGQSFLGYLQNHDQIGNRVHGDRLSKLVNTNRLKIGAALIFTAPFIPMIFQGEEWGTTTPFLYFTDHQNQELGKAVLAGRIQEFAAFGWQPSEVPDPQAIDAFTSSKINWEELAQESHATILNWYRSLIALRKQFSDLNNGKISQIKIIFDEAEKWFMIKRKTIITIVNFALNQQMIARSKLQLNDISLSVLLTSDSKNLFGKDEIILQAESVMVLEDIA